MSTRRTTLATLAAVALGSLPACQREERVFRPAPGGAEVVPRTETAALHAGTRVPPGPPRSGAALPNLSGRNRADKQAYAVSEGRRLYNAFNCVGCHSNGGGGMGPPLMDEKWLYGSEPEDIYRTLVQGRPNGMPAFGGRLTDDQIWRLTAFVRSMSGLVDSNTAPGRDDHMKGSPPPASAKAEEPVQQEGESK